MFNKFRFVVFFVMLGISSSLISTHIQAATLNVSSGQLVGANDVDVGGTLYDVEFLDGTCIALFDGCDDASDFAFVTAADAAMAAQALLDFVFVDGPSGDFDARPELTAGCGDPLICQLIIPFAPTPSPSTSFLAALAQNNAPRGVDAVSLNVTVDPSSDMASLAEFAFVAFTPVSAVPVPAAIWLFGTALIGLVGFSRRKAA